MASQRRPFDGSRHFVPSRKLQGFQRLSSSKLDSVLSAHPSMPRSLSREARLNIDSGGFPQGFRAERVLRPFDPSNVDFLSPLRFADWGVRGTLDAAVAVAGGERRQ